MANLNSTQLLKDFLSNRQDKDLLVQMHAKYWPFIRRIAKDRGLNEHDAEDMASTIFMRLIVSKVVDRFVFHTKAKFNKWMIVTVTNEVHTLRRNRGRKRLIAGVDGEKWFDEIGAEVTQLYADDLDRVKKDRARVQTQVGERAWEVFNRIVEKDENVATVADELAMTKAAVYQTISRTKRKLREALADFWQ